MTSVLTVSKYSILPCWVYGFQFRFSLLVAVNGYSVVGLGVNKYLNITLFTFLIIGSRWENVL